MAKKEGIRKLFDNIAPDYDKLNHILSLNIDKGWRKKAVREIVDVQSPLTVLDVACGTGILFPDYLNRGAKVTGVDISSEMLRVAREKFPDIKVICADAETYNFEDKYDAVMIYNAFPHFPEPQKLMTNLSKALKCGGRLTVAHGLSEEELEKCHSTAAKDVSLPLPSKEKLADMMSEHFKVDIAVSDEEKYIVSGIKR
jgi:demethylmenaquinone methyltransferase/2-methoxy-6-polyprenyl-1,4-benzoquinol methylase